MGRSCQGVALVAESPERGIAAGDCAGLRLRNGPRSFLRRPLCRRRCFPRIRSVSAPRRKRALIALAALACALAVAGVLGELALRADPMLLPSWYRERFPLHGVEFFRPGVLAETPIDALVLPYPVGPHDGPPPADLAVIGVASPDDRSDALRFPRLVLPIDRQGLPNAVERTRADVVLVGDSFALWAAITEPPGLLPRLEQETGLSIHDVGVSGIGPRTELWLLREVGLHKEPKLVLWFFFGGNDPYDALTLVGYERRGCRTFADVFGEKRPPPLWMPSVLHAAFDRWRSEPARPSLPPFRFEDSSGREHATWFHPIYLAYLAATRAQWEQDPGWLECQRVLREGRSLVEAAGARFVLVYLPSKEQVYLPVVEPDADLVRSTVAHERPDALRGDAAELLRDCLAHRGELETLVSEFALREGMFLLSATPTLEAFAARGEPCYLAADTHWDPLAQGAFVAPLLAFLHENQLLPAR